MNKVAQVIEDSAVSVGDIAARCSLTPARVQELASGASATLQELRALAHGLRLPIRAFGSKAQRSEELELLFRVTPGNRADLGVEAAGDFVSASLTILPKRQILPEWIRELHPPANSYTDAVAVADRFRASHVENVLDPIDDLPGLLVRLGGLVLGRLDTSRFEGASAVVDGYAFIFVSPRFLGRMLFTLAHELGHVLAHHREPRSASFDAASQIGNVRNRNIKEAFADAFASALLMPSEGLAIALREIRAALGISRDELGDVEILYLANLYGISFEVAARRCEQLELLPEGGAYSLSDHVKKMYGTAEKFARQVGVPSRKRIDFPRASQNLLDAAAQRIADGEVSIGWVTDRLGCSVTDLYSARAVSEAPRVHRA